MSAVISQSKSTRIDLPASNTLTTKILFVCHANICRSPMAEAVMSALVLQAGMAARIGVASAGTHARVGEPYYERTQETLHRYGVVPMHGVARQLEYEDLNRFDYVLAMDRRNLTFILRYSLGSRADVRLLLDFAPTPGTGRGSEVKDPFPNGNYDEAYAHIYEGCAALLKHLMAV